AARFAHGPGRGRPAHGAGPVIRGFYATRRGAKRDIRGERGQILPWAVVTLAGAALLAVFVARAGMVLERRTRLQTAVDATALSAATAYARGLNIVAASNQLLFTAALIDAGVKLSGAGLAGSAAAHAVGGKAPVSLTRLVMNFQDAWAGTAGGNHPMVRSAGAAPASMQAAALLVGARNGLTPVILWNGRDGPDGLLPDLNVRRADLAD